MAAKSAELALDDAPYLDVEGETVQVVMTDCFGDEAIYVWRYSVGGYRVEAQEETGQRIGGNLDTLDEVREMVTELADDCDLFGSDHWIPVRELTAICVRCGKSFVPTADDGVPAEIGVDGRVLSRVYGCPECRAADPDYDWLGED